MSISKEVEMELLKKLRRFPENNAGFISFIERFIYANEFSPSNLFLKELAKLVNSFDLFIKVYNMMCYHAFELDVEIMKKACQLCPTNHQKISMFDEAQNYFSIKFFESDGYGQMQAAKYYCQKFWTNEHFFQSFFTQGLLNNKYDPKRTTTCDYKDMKWLHNFSYNFENSATLMFSHFIIFLNAEL